MRKDISKVFVCEISLFDRFHHHFTHWRDHLLRFGGTSKITPFWDATMFWTSVIRTSCSLAAARSAAIGRS